MMRFLGWTIVYAIAAAFVAATITGLFVLGRILGASETVSSTVILVLAIGGAVEFVSNNIKLNTQHITTIILAALPRS